MNFDHAIIGQRLIGEAESARHSGCDHRVGRACIKDTDSLDAVEPERQFQPARLDGESIDKRGRLVPWRRRRIAPANAIQREQAFLSVDVEVVKPQDVQAEDAIERLIAPEGVYRQPIDRKCHGADRHAVDAGIWSRGSAAQTHERCLGSRIAVAIQPPNYRLTKQALLRTSVQQHVDRVAIDGDGDDEDVVLELKRHLSNRHEFACIV